MDGSMELNELREQLSYHIEAIEGLKGGAKSIESVNSGLNTFFTDISSKTIILKANDDTDIVALFDELNKVGFIKAWKLGRDYKPCKVKIDKKEKKGKIMSAQMKTVERGSISTALGSTMPHVLNVSYQRFKFYPFEKGIKHITSPVQKFELALDFIQQRVEEADVIYPNIREALKKESIKALKAAEDMAEQMRLAGAGLPYLDAERKKREDEEHEARGARWKKEADLAYYALLEEKKRGVCKGFKIDAEALNGLYFYFGGSTDGQEAVAKIYGAIKGEQTGEFVHRLTEFARTYEREHGTSLNFQGKFFNLGIEEAHNRLVMYVPFEELPRLTEFLAQNKQLFKPVKMNHPFGVQLFPGVSTVLASKGHSSKGSFGFDKEFDAAVRKYAVEISKKYPAGQRPIQPLIDDLLKDPTTHDHMDFLLKRNDFFLRHNSS